MMRSALFFVGLALAVTLTTSCKKEKKDDGKVEIEVVEGTYKGTLTKAGKAEESTAKVRSATAVETVLGTAVIIESGNAKYDAKIKSNEKGKLTLSIDGLLAKGEAVISGSELTYSLTYGATSEKHEFKGKKQ